MVAKLHADARHRVSVGTVLTIGRKWAQDAEADHLLVSLPLPYGPDFEICDIGEHHVRFLWLVPITEQEARLAQTEGVEALEALLEGSQANVVDPRRKSLV